MQSVTDAELVVQAQAGRVSAFGELYERHFDGVYDFLARMVRNPEEAADLAQDAFLKAMKSLAGLQHPERFKSWLFSIARNTALNRLERAGPTSLVTTDEEGSELAMDVLDADRLADPEEAAQAQAMAALVWEASAGLDARQLSILDLHLRQGMESAEIADVLGVTKNNGYVLLNRIKKAVEDSIGAFVMLKEGHNHCADLEAVLGDAEIDRMSQEARKLVSRHTKSCSECGERRKRLVSPLAVFGTLATIGPSIGVKAQILEDLQQQWPAQTIGADIGSPRRALSAPGGTPPSGGGIPVAAGRPGSFFGGSLLAIVGGLAVALVVLAGALLFPFSPLSPNQRDDGSASPVLETPTAGASSVDATASQTPSPTPAPSPSATSTQTPIPTPTDVPPPPGTTVTPSPTPTLTPTVTATPTQTPLPTATQPPCEPTVATTHKSLLVAPDSSAEFFVSDANACDELSFIISVAPGAPWLVVNETAGSVKGSGTFKVSLAVDSSEIPGEGTFVGQITVASDDSSVIVKVSTERGNAPVIDPVSPLCHTADVGATISAFVSDDFGVVSVSISYKDATGTPTTGQLTRNDGEPTGANWSIETEDFGPDGFVITAVDDGGHQAILENTTFGPCP